MYIIIIIIIMKPTPPSIVHASPPSPLKGTTLLRIAVVLAEEVPLPEDAVREAHHDEGAALALVVDEVAKGRHEILLGEANHVHDSIVQPWVHVSGLVVPDGLGDVSDS